MAENPRITVGGKPNGARDSHDKCAEIISLELDILGKPVNLRIGVGQGQARLTDIVPLAQVVCTKITDAVLERIRSDAGRIPCRKGCSACCRSLVPLSVPEALRLREAILAMPESQRRLMQQSCLLVAQRILKRKPPKSFVGQTTGTSPNSLAEWNKVASWYTNLNLDCPFHYKGVCTIYEQRPLALFWAQENVERAKQTWPAAMMAERFVEIVKAMASKNSTAVVAKT